MNQQDSDVAVAERENGASTLKTGTVSNGGVGRVIPNLEFPRNWSAKKLNPFKRGKEITGTMLGIGVALIIASVVLFRGGSKQVGPVGGAVPVTVQTITEQKVRLWSEFSGRLQAVDSAEIRPEVSGRITSVRFEDGKTVKKGQILFVIDPQPYEAALARAQANAEFAKTELARAEELVKSQAIAERVYDERANASRVADAELSRAQVDVSRAYVKAPISGRVSRAEITVGNVVQSGMNAPLLTTVVSNSSVYADFEVDDQTYLQSVRENASTQAGERAIPVELTIQGDKEITYKGTIESFDNKIDSVSGTIRARAKFANKDGVLMPGMFVSVRMGSSGEKPALLIPERAVGVDQNKKFVYVVGPENKVAYREVTLGKKLATDRVVLAGVQAGDRVIVDGIQHVRPDVVVDPKELVVTPPPAVAATPAPQSPATK